MSDFSMEDFEFPLGNPSAYINEAIAAGWSANFSYAMRGEAGFSMGRGAFLNLWGEQLAAFADRESIQDVSWDALPDAGTISDWSTTSGAGYVYHFDLTVRDIETGAVETKTASIKSDLLITPNDAFDALADLYADNAAAYGETLLGGNLLNVFAVGGTAA